MDDRLKQRLVGAVVLVVAAVVFVPMLLEDDEASTPREHTLVPPPAPEHEPLDASARVIPLGDEAAAPKADAARATAEPATPAAATEPSSAASGSTPAAPKASAEVSGFAVQLGSFSKANNARGLRDRLVAKGYTAYLVTKDSVTRVYVGPQASRAEAERVRKKLLAETKLKGIVVEHAG